MTCLNSLQVLSAIILNKGKYKFFEITKNGLWKSVTTKQKTNITVLSNINRILRT